MRRGGPQALLKGKLKRNEPGPGLIEFISREQIPEPGQVGDEFDSAAQLSHLPQPLETICDRARAREQSLGHGYGASVLRDHGEKAGRVVAAGLQIIHVGQHVLAEAASALMLRGMARTHRPIVGTRVIFIWTNRGREY
jgi:hypothetical protein